MNSDKPPHKMPNSETKHSDAKPKPLPASASWKTENQSQKLWSALFVPAKVMIVLSVLFLSACVTPRVVTETETVFVEVERLVPVSPELTYAQEPPTRPLVLWIDSLALMIEYRHRWESCEIRMEEIRGLGGE